MFERFTEDARRSVVCAQEESRALNHTWIGTEHLLLGLFREESGRASVILLSFGVSLTDAREAAVAVLGHGGRPPAGHIPFTARGKRVLERSMREAIRLDHPSIGSEHLLLGLLDETEGAGAQILARLNIDPGEARLRVLSSWTSGPEPDSSSSGSESPPWPRTSAHKQGRDLVRELEAVRAAKDAALDEGDLTRAAELRNREKVLVALDRTARVRNQEKLDLYVQARLAELSAEPGTAAEPSTAAAPETAAEPPSAPPPD